MSLFTGAVATADDDPRVNRETPIMTRTLDVEREERRRRRAERLLYVAEYGLVDMLHNLGAELQGLSMKTSNADCLMTIRAVFEGKGMICFVGGPTVADVLLKAFREADANELRWREDQYYKDGS